MSIKDRLLEDMKIAMREKEAGRFRLSVIRMVRSSIKYAEINEHRELNDDEVIEIISKEVKMRRDSFDEFTKAGREQMALDASKEIDILMAYLPKQLTKEDIRVLVSKTIKELQATGPKDMGKVMGALRSETKGRADGKIVSNIVKELLHS